MIELVDDVFYKEYSNYIDSCVDYFIIKSNNDNSYDNHKRVLEFIIKKLDYSYDYNKIKGNIITNEKYFSKEFIRYFLEAPFGIPNRKLVGEEVVYNNYSIVDYEYLNTLLFPSGIDDLEIYEWSVDWSDYFDIGLEWWGAKCVSIFDNALNRYVVFMSSVSD